MTQPTVVDKPGFRVIGLETPFIHALSPDSNAAEVLTPLWGRFLHDAKSIELKAGPEMYGVMYARPESERAHPDELQYLTVVPVEADATVPDGMVEHFVPATSYAVFVHRGPITTLHDTIRFIYQDWLPNSSFEHSREADVELYDDRFDPESADSEMEYWVSVRSKT